MAATYSQDEHLEETEADPRAEVGLSFDNVPAFRYCNSRVGFRIGCPLKTSGGEWALTLIDEYAAKV